MTDTVDAPGTGGPPTPVPPGVHKPDRGRPRVHYELIDCGLRGHVLLGTDVARVRPADAVGAQRADHGARWRRNCAAPP